MIQSKEIRVAFVRETTEKREGKGGKLAERAIFMDMNDMMRMWVWVA